ncbi:MATE family efflux transporter [Oceanobacillus saliphilus]|uniref:MATE family efflux transporter n=1 Tax=Oceanobacillus saliphilus TaxID=2925834 RepID=UPI00201E538D|nr:MATE family efflux transporter [Oceanobacillus saliphilus]
MYETSTMKEKIRLFIIILIPILITQLSLNLMTFFDTVMSGRAGAEDLAGVAIGSSLWVPISTGINGIVLAITPIIAHIIGSKMNDEVPKIVQQGIYLAIILSILIIAAGGFALDPVLSLMDLDENVRTIAKYYLISISAGIIPLFIFNTIRCFMDGLGQTRASMIIILISLPLNIFFNYIFIFGKLGLPAFGGIGAGIATAITYWLVSIISLIVMIRVHPFSKFNVFTKVFKPDFKLWINQLKIGMPIGAAIFFETSIFSAVTLLMSVYSTYTIAAHQAALNFAGLLYMIPLSVGMALTITIGFEVGAKHYKDARTYGYIGMSSGIFIAIFAALILYVFNEPVAALYNSEPEVIELTRKFIYFAIFYQLADAFGAPIQGALRGYKDVNMTLIIAFISYWIIGLPTGWILANYTSLEPFGYWVGIIIGLSFGAAALLWRLIHIQKKYS